MRKGVRIEECWTARINSDLEDAVNEVNGNLSRLAKSERPEVIEEFGKIEERKKPTRNRTLIGILNKKPGKQGSVEIIDGAHRLVAMWTKEVKKTNMFLGKPKMKS